MCVCVCVCVSLWDQSQLIYFYVITKISGLLTVQQKSSLHFELLIKESLLPNINLNTDVQLGNHVKKMRRLTFLFIISSKRKKIFQCDFLQSTRNLSGKWGKKIFFQNFQNLGSKWGNPQIDYKKGKMLFSTITVQKLNQTNENHIWIGF